MKTLKKMYVDGIINEYMLNFLIDAYFTPFKVTNVEHSNGVLSVKINNVELFIKLENLEIRIINGRGENFKTQTRKCHMIDCKSYLTKAILHSTKRADDNYVKNRGC